MYIYVKIIPQCHLHRTWMIFKIFPLNKFTNSLITKIYLLLFHAHKYIMHMNTTSCFFFFLSKFQLSSYLQTSIFSIGKKPLTFIIVMCTSIIERIFFDVRLTILSMLQLFPYFCQYLSKEIRFIKGLYHVIYCSIHNSTIELVFHSRERRS